MRASGAPDRLEACLQAFTRQPEDPACFIELALALGAPAEIPIECYVHELRGFAAAVRADLAHRLSAGEPDDAATRQAALITILVEREGFAGEPDAADSPDQTALFRVMDRRRGGSAALGILYLFVGAEAGLTLAGVDFPGRFLVALTHGPARRLLDPVQGGVELTARDLRALLKSTQGVGAELSATYTQGGTYRDALVRLQNAVKKRQISAEDYAGALQTVEVLRRIAPDEHRLLLDAGVLAERVGQVGRAIDFLEMYLTHLPPRHPHRAEVIQLLAHFRAGG